MKRNNSGNRVQWPGWRLIIAGLITLALSLSIILSWHFLKGGTMVGCGGGSPCEQVLNSKWSVIAGIFPISGLATGIYLALLVALLFSGPSEEGQIRRIAWKAMLVIAGAITGSAIWFTVLQKWFIGDFCPYCMTTHVTGLLLSLLIISRASKETDYESREKKKLLRPVQVMVLAFAGLTLSGVMAASQVALTPKSVSVQGESQNFLPEIDYNKVPLVGVPYAPYKITLLFDYQCPHCQKLHFLLNDAVRIYEGKLAFALCPTPLNSECNPYVPASNESFKNSCELARIGMAVWLADQSAFPDFEDWMFTYESGDKWIPRSPESAMAKAIELTGRERLDEAMSDPWINNYISKSVQMFGQTGQDGRSGIPKMIFGSQWIIPQPVNAEELISLLQNNLLLPKP
ncbi:MAG TPA: vitamin K epoxide reductase family protein [Bacteroidales bacterium]|nr:vitamin K epoxide reductase family protein [Bacteroidales bacterium]